MTLNAKRRFWTNEVLNKSPQMRGARIGMGLQGSFRRQYWINILINLDQYLDMGKKFNAADRPADREKRAIARREGLVQPLPTAARWRDPGAAMSRFNMLLN